MFQEHYHFHYLVKQLDKAGNTAAALELFVGLQLGFRNGENVILYYSVNGLVYLRQLRHNMISKRKTYLFMHSSDLISD